MLKLVGLEDLQTYLPPTRMSIEELATISGLDSTLIHQATGLQSKPVAETQDSLELAIAAVEQLFERLNIDRGAIRYILFAEAGLTNNLAKSPAAQIQKLLDANNAFSFEISNGCNAANLGLRLARDLLMAESEHQYALLISSDILSKHINYQNHDHRALFNFADAATAVLLSNRSVRNKVLNSTFMTDPHFLDYMTLSKDTHHFLLQQQTRLKPKLQQAYLENYQKVIHTTLDCAQIKLSQIKAIYISQGHYKLLDKLANRLHVSPNIIARTYTNLGHLGGSDTFYAFKEDLRQRCHQPDDHVLLVSSAFGFSWGCSLVKL